MRSVSSLGRRAGKFSPLGQASLPLVAASTCTDTLPFPFAHNQPSEWLMELYAQYFTKFYIMISRVPSWLLGVLSTSVASLLIGLLHRASPARPAALAAQPEPVAPAPTTATPKKQAKSKNLTATPSAATLTTDSEHDSASTTGTPKRTPKQRRSKK